MQPDQPFRASHTPIDLEKYDRPYEVGRASILRALLPEGGGQQALDVGCGPGYFSRELATRGWRTTAIDTDPTNIEAARAVADVVLQGGALDVIPTLTTGAYGLVLCLEIIEHMPREHGVLLVESLARVLAPGGLLLLSTPNRHSPEGLGGLYWGERVRRWGRWTAWDPTHVHIYSSSEILRLLRGCGFSPEKVVGFHYAGTLPLIGDWHLPLEHSSRFPLNRVGFNTIVLARKARHPGRG